MDAYYLDWVCVSRDYKDRAISRNLIQTHEYNQRILNPVMSVSMFKKEIDLCEGIVPLVEYNTYTFYLRSIKPPGLPRGVHIRRITKTTISMLIDFLEKIKETPKFNARIFSDISVLSNQIESDQLYAYCLCYDEGVIMGYYFFRNANLQYEDLVEGAADCDTLQFVGSYNNTGDINGSDVFFLGFLHVYQNILVHRKTYKMMLFEGISHNGVILEKWLTRFHITLQHRCAYYLYNVGGFDTVSPDKLFLL